MPPPAELDMRDLLLGHIAWHRSHVLEMIDGLSDEDLTRPVLPSGWSIVGLLHHLALDDDRFWVRAVIAGDEQAQASLSENAWQVPDDLSPEQVIALHREEAEKADAVLSGVDLAAAPAWWPDFMANMRMTTNAEVILRVLAEYAIHAGHLDAARELIDGKQYVVIT